MSKHNLPTLIPAQTLNVKLPEPSDILLETDARQAQDAVVKSGVITMDAKYAVERSGVQSLLATDDAGVNKVIAELPKNQKIKDGSKVYVKTPAINLELSRRIQETRDPYQIERLKYAEKCLNAVRDAPELEIRRTKLEARGRKEMPKIKREVLKNASTCISGEPLQQGAEVHHIERVADNPDRALDPSNMKAVNPKIHDQIHAAQAHSQQALDELAKKNGWPRPPQISEK